MKSTLVSRIRKTKVSKTPGSITSLEHCPDFLRVARGRLAGGAGAEVNHGSFLYWYFFCEWLDGAGVAQHHFVRLINGMGCANQGASGRRVGTSDNDSALRFLQ